MAKCDFCVKYGYSGHGGVYGGDVKRLSIRKIGGKNIWEQFVCGGHRRVLKSDGYRVFPMGKSACEEAM